MTAAAPDVRRDLDRWGPVSTDRSVTRAEAEDYTRRLAQSHYENFPVASWLAPRRLRQHLCNVYAFCRWADDLGDELGGGERALELLGWWRRELEACFTGEPRHPVFVALRPTVEAFAIPQQPFADLISAFEQDQQVREYETFARLRDYCRRSADPVGRIVLHLYGAVTPQNVDWSDSICTGLQLANLWQDVARDYDIGRVYLPRDDRDRFEYAPEALQSRTTNDAFRGLLRFEVDRAREFLERGFPLVDALPGRLGWEIELIVRGGLAILREIEGIGYGVWEQRPALSKRRFAGLLPPTLWRRLTRPFARRPADSRHA